MGPVVHGVNTPVATSAVVVLMQNAVHHGIPHQHIGRGHVDFRSQHMGSFGVFPLFHFLKYPQVFLYRTVPEGARFARLSRCPLLIGHFF